MSQHLLIIMKWCFTHTKQTYNASPDTLDRLERMQLEAARIVTCITRSISTIKLYDEIGWLTLEDRRKYQKFVLTFKLTLRFTTQV